MLSALHLVAHSRVVNKIPCAAGEQLPFYAGRTDNSALTASSSLLAISACSASSAAVWRIDDSWFDDLQKDTASIDQHCDSMTGKHKCHMITFGTPTDGG
jgi:hypothetical protein